MVFNFHIPENHGAKNCKKNRAGKLMPEQREAILTKNQRSMLISIATCMFIMT